MSLVNILIIEDDVVIAQSLKLFLEKNGYRVAGMLDRGENLRTLIQQTSIDLVLLDIELAGGLNGVDIAPLLKHEFHLPFIYLTAQSDPATLNRAALTEPYAYLVKPFREEELRAALEIALYKIRKEACLLASPAQAREALFVKNKNRLEKLDLSEILYIEAKDIYCIVKTEKGQFVLSHSLKTLEGQLSSEAFVRIHRSYLVALDKIRAIEDNQVIVGAEHLPVGKTYRERLLQILRIL